MKRGASHGRSGVSTFQDKEPMSMQAYRWVEYLRKSKEAMSMQAGRWVEYLRKSKEANMARVLSEEDVV